MTRATLVEILKKVKTIKARTQCRIIDTHVHPGDVMGVVHYQEPNIVPTAKKDFLQPGPMEFLNYGSIEKLGTALFFRIAPKGVEQIIKDTYCCISPKRILDEMDVALIDRAIFLPIAPWFPTESAVSCVVSSRMSTLGSINIHAIKEEEIKEKIHDMVVQFGIRGLKLHPNLQGFLPQPKDNPPALGAKLKTLYATAEQEKLYILFHGGISFLPNFIHPKYNSQTRSRTFGKLSNFCNEQGRSELFEKYQVPIVIAHLGHYGIPFPNYRLIKTIVNRFSNVYFDTSGVSPSVIAHSLACISYKRIVFGSDALYNRMAYNLAFVFEAVRRAKFSHAKEDILVSILGATFERSIESFHG